jgi:hypothetical protein
MSTRWRIIVSPSPFRPSFIQDEYSSAVLAWLAAVCEVCINPYAEVVVQRRICQDQRAVIQQQTGRAIRARLGSRRGAIMSRVEADGLGEATDAWPPAHEGRQ